MITSVYARISEIKQTKYDKLLQELKLKLKELEDLKEQKRLLDEELEQLLESFPKKKKAVYEEYLQGDGVNKSSFEKIGYKIMVLEHEISAHRLKIKSQEELIEVAEKGVEELQSQKKILSKTLEKYSILIEADIEEQKIIAEMIEDNEMEEFAKPQKGL